MRILSHLQMLYRINANITFSITNYFDFISNVNLLNILILFYHGSEGSSSFFKEIQDTNLMLSTGGFCMLRVWPALKVLDLSLGMYLVVGSLLGRAPFESLIRLKSRFKSLFDYFFTKTYDI